MSTKRAVFIAKDCRVLSNSNQSNFGSLSGSRDDQYNSINLNKFGATKALHSDSIISSKNNENINALQNLTGFVKVSDSETNKGFSDLWQKDSLLKTNSYRHNYLQEDKTNEYKGHSKNFAKNLNKSTLSVHIEAYENANEAQNNVEAKVVSELKASEMDKVVIPRQQLEESMEAEVMAFKLSKPVLNLSGKKVTEGMLRVLKPHPRQLLAVRYAGHGHHHEDSNIERKPDNYRPGSDSYAYENPWPKLNGGRLDWLFQDGWRRPLAKDQGAKTRREWLWFGQNPHDEHADWYRVHYMSFFAFTALTMWITWWIVVLRPDWPQGNEWALREAHLEIVRRKKAGLPLISKDLIDPQRVALSLPSEEELRDFEILI